MLNKLKIVKNISIWSTDNTWNTYRDIVSTIKAKILDGDIKVLNVRYGDNFDEKYRPYTDKNNWGSNLDEYSVKINSSLKASISYYSLSRYSSMHQHRSFKFEIQFNLPKDILPLFKDVIEREFYHKCCEIREEELKKIEKNRIKEIGRELLKRKS